MSGGGLAVQMIPEFCIQNVSKTMRHFCLLRGNPCTARYF